MTTPHVDAASLPVIGRRELFAGAGVAALAALVAGSTTGLLDGLPFVGDPALPFDRAPLAEQIGEQFRIATGPDRGATLVLDRIVELPTTVTDAELQFAARFSGAAGLAQDTYEFTTRSFGRLPLFISPVSEPAAVPAVYEAIVNRHVPRGAEGGVTP